MESLARAGAFDCFENTHRAQYFFQENSDDPVFLEKIIKNAADFHTRKNAMQQSLFGESEEIHFNEFTLPDCRPWTKLEQLKFEKEVTGFYLSGHPLDDYQMEMEQFCNVTIEDLKKELKPLKGKELLFAGIVIEANHKTGKTGKKFASFMVEDYYNFINLTVFSEEYLKWKHFLEEGQYLFIKARVEGRFDNPDQLVIRVNNIMLLSEVMEKLTRAVSISIEINELAVDTIYKLHTLAKQFKGRSAMRLRIHDDTENLSIELPSKKYRINAKEMIRELIELPGIQVQVLQE